MNSRTLRKSVRILLLAFIAALVASGLTAIPMKLEIGILNGIMGQGTFMESLWPAMAAWISSVFQGITETHEKYPFMFYTADWLAFAHIVIAIAFVGPLRDPVKNVWVVEFGMIACILIIPLALVFGPIRGIPFFWQLIDCCFGIFGIIPLLVIRVFIRKIMKLEKEAAASPEPLPQT